MPLDHQLNGNQVSAPDITNLIIVSDLDGTLLDHQTYSHAAADPALNQLRQLNVPLILASSKTAAEIIPLREEMGFAHCEAIVENGSGILENHDGNSTIEDKYQLIQQTRNQLPSRLGRQYQGFSDWSAEQISERTGLPFIDAVNAKKRQFSEPGLWLGNEEERQEFIAAINQKGLIVQQGGRFMTLSFGGNKAVRMIEIASRHATDGKMPFIVALGDANNDVAMIEQADLGVIVPNPAHRGIPRLEGETTGQIIRAKSDGPAGWNEVIMSLLNPAGKQ